MVFSTIRLFLVRSTFALAFFSVPSSLLAQNTSSVSGPEVNAGDRKFDYRAAYEVRDDGAASAFAHRFHYQHSFNDRWLARAILIQSERGGEALKSRSASIEIVRQFLESEDTGGWDSSFFADGRIPLESDRPGRARAAWLNSFEIDERLRLRANLYLGHEFGDLAMGGVTVETREELTRKLDNDMSVGLQAFHNLNASSHFGGFHEQRHQVGPIIKGDLTRHLSYSASALFGVSHDAPDADLRLFLTYSPAKTP